MEAYRVTHKASGERYFLLADSAAHAVEVVELRIGDPETAEAWDAIAETPGFELRRGIVYDGEGRPTVPLE